VADFKSALREELDRLRDALRPDPKFQNYEIIAELLARYEAEVVSSPSSPVAGSPPTSQSPPTRRPPFAPSETGMAAVQRASADFLRARGSRAASPEIHAEMVRLGLMKPGDRDRTMVTSYLSRDKAMFDNVRGQGYGLREWSASPPDHGPASGDVSAAGSNGLIRAAL
jgi:hypothetical protein